MMATKQPHHSHTNYPSNTHLLPQDWNLKVRASTLHPSAIHVSPIKHPRDDSGLAIWVSSSHLVPISCTRIPHLSPIQIAFPRSPERLSFKTHLGRVCFKPRDGPMCGLSPDVSCQSFPSLLRQGESQLKNPVKN